MDGFVADLVAFGAPAAMIEEARRDAAKRAPEAAFVIHPDNGAAIRLLLALQTQWRKASLSTMARAEVISTGLDYGVVSQVADLDGITLDLPADFRRLRMAEAEMLAAWSEERARISR